MITTIEQVSIELTWTECLIIHKALKDLDLLNEFDMTDMDIDTAKKDNEIIRELYAKFDDIIRLR